MTRRSTRRNTSRKYKGGRGGMGGADLGHAFTTGASQELYQMTGKTPGLSSGGKRSARRSRKTRRTHKRSTRRN
jgi:hypothetical protein